MPVLDLALVCSWLLLVAGARAFLNAHRTGEPAVRFADRRGSPQWWARSISVSGRVIAGLRPAGVSRAPWACGPTATIRVA